MARKHHIVFLTGAGISQESGISTFRDQNGLWENYAITEVASPEGFAKNPQLVLDFYNARRKQLDEVVPNLAHELIAQLEQKYKVTVITQNVDDLHERAGSTNVIHLHGELKKCRSVLDDTEIFDYHYPLQLGDLAPNGGQLRPHIVWFGEAVPEIDLAIEVTQTADLFVIVGTTMQVQPAASLLLSVPIDVQTVYIDVAPDVDKGINLLVLKEKATVGMQVLVDDYLPY
jgi:NAD-dependent deacetylase